jgi:hypothetical protein
VDLLRKARAWWTGRSKRVQAGLALGVALVIGVLLAAATGGGGSDLDEGEAAQAEAQARTTQTQPGKELKVRKLPELVSGRGDETKEKPVRRRPVKLIDRPLPETEARVRRIFSRTVARGSRAGLLTAKLRRIECTGGACEMEYLSDGPGAGKIIESQGAIWRELFSNPRVKQATVIADPGGPDLAAGQQQGAQPVIVHCDRSALNTIRDIGRNAGPWVKRECAVSAEERAGQ